MKLKSRIYSSLQHRHRREAIVCMCMHRIHARAASQSVTFLAQNKGHPTKRITPEATDKRTDGNKKACPRHPLLAPHSLDHRHGQFGQELVTGHGHVTFSRFQVMKAPHVVPSTPTPTASTAATVGSVGVGVDGREGGGYAFPGAVDDLQGIV